MVLGRNAAGGILRHLGGDGDFHRLHGTDGDAVDVPEVGPVVGDGPGDGQVGVGLAHEGAAGGHAEGTEGQGVLWGGPCVPMGEDVHPADDDERTHGSLRSAG